MPEARTSRGSARAPANPMRQASKQARFYELDMPDFDHFDCHRQCFGGTAGVSSSLSYRFGNENAIEKGNLPGGKIPDRRWGEYPPGTRTE